VLQARRAAGDQEGHAAEDPGGQRGQQPLLGSEHEQDAGAEHVGALADPEDDHRQPGVHQQGGPAHDGGDEDQAGQQAGPQQPPGLVAVRGVAQPLVAQAGQALAARPGGQQRGDQRGMQARAGQQRGGGREAHRREPVEQAVQQRLEPADRPRVRRGRRLGRLPGHLQVHLIGQREHVTVAVPVADQLVTEPVELQRAGDLQRIHRRLAHVGEVSAQVDDGPGHGVGAGRGDRPQVVQPVGGRG
jgi:hypothetical protein